MEAFGGVPIRKVLIAALTGLATAYLCGGCSGAPSALSACAADRAAAAQQLNAISRAEQAAIARRIPVYRDPALECRIGSVLEKLLTPINGRPHAFRIILLSDPFPDAYSFPDGGIYLHTGLLACLENEAELALLLAHEVIHVIREHALLAYQQSAAETGLETVSEDAGGGLSLAARWNAPMAAARWMHQRRALEEEADRMGLDLVMRAHYDPHVALKIFDDVKHDGLAVLSAERLAALHTFLAARTQTVSRQTAPPGSFRSDLQSLLLHQAQSDARLGRWHNALKLARRYVRDFPDQAQGHYWIAEILRQRQAPGDLQQALAYYLKAIGLNPRCAKSHKAAGLLHLRQGRFDLAGVYFRSAMALSPDPGDAAYLVSYLASLPITRKGDN